MNTLRPAPGLLPSAKPARRGALLAKPPTPKPLQRVSVLARHLRRELTVVVVYAAALGVLTLATPIAVQVLINTIAFGGLRQPVVVVSLLLAAGLGLAAMFQAAQTVAVEAICQRLFVSTAIECAQSLAGASSEVHSQKDLRRLSNHFYDIVTVDKTTWSLLIDGPSATLQILVGLTLLAFYHPFLLLFGAGMSLASLFIIFVLGRGAINTAIRESSYKHRVAARLQEIGQHPVLFSSEGGRQFAVHRIADEADQWLHARQKHFRIILGQMLGFWALQAVGSSVLLMAGGSLVVAGQLTLGQLVAAEIVMAVTAASLAKLGKLLPKFYDLTTALVKLAAVKELSQETCGGVHLDADDADSVHLNNVVLHGYQGPLTAPFSLRVEPRSFTVVTGTRDQLGALRDLIHRRTMVAEGQLLIDDTPVELWDPGALRDRILILSVHWLAGKDIFDQVRLGNLQASDAEIRTVLARVGLEPLVVAWARNEIDSAAMEISRLDAGQRAALAVARALVAKPALVLCHLLLDGLSEGWQRHLLSVLERPGNGWTSIVLSEDSQLVATMVSAGRRTVTLPVPPREEQP